MSESGSRGREKMMKSKRMSVILIAVILLAVAIGYYFSTTVKVPKISGLSVAEAKEQLEAASLEYTEGDPIYSEDYRKGKVAFAEKEGKRVNKNSTVEIIESLGAEISMYQLVGVTQEEAEEKLGEAGLAMKFKMEYSDEYKEGLVMTQSVGEGTLVYEESKIILTVSKGAKPIVLEKYEGKSLKDVQKEAEKIGLKIKIEKKNSSEVDEGDIISQSPKAGTEVKKGDTVTLTVSKGPVKVKVPDLYGMSESQARKALEDAGLKLGSVHKDYSSSVSSGLVMGQGEDAGDKIAEGTSVSITISLGKKPSYSRPSYSKPSKPSSSDDGPVDIELEDSGPVDIELE